MATTEKSCTSVQRKKRSTGYLHKPGIQLYNVNRDDGHKLIMCTCTHNGSGKIFIPPINSYVVRFRDSCALDTVYLPLQSVNSLGLRPFYRNPLDASKVMANLVKTSLKMLSEPNRVTNLLMFLAREASFKNHFFQTPFP